jgi:hypothetical protein
MALQCLYRSADFYLKFPGEESQVQESHVLQREITSCAERFGDRNRLKFRCVLAES